MSQYGDTCHNMVIHVTIWLYMSQYGNTCHNMVIHVTIWFYMSQDGYTCVGVAAFILGLLSTARTDRLDLGVVAVGSTAEIKHKHNYITGT